MDRDHIRLECLKIAIQRTRDQKELLASAEQMFSFVTDGQKIIDNAVPTSADVTAGTGLQPAGQTAEVGPKSKRWYHLR